jgi:hypothetical protein
MSELKTFKDLQKWTGYTKANKVKECLEFKGIPYTISNKGICTTETAINRALNEQKQEVDLSL